MVGTKGKKTLVTSFVCLALLLVLVIILENTLKPTNMLFTVLKKGAVYALVVVSMNVLNGFTGLFSLGQSGFMLLGAYTYAIFTIPVADRENIYYLYNGAALNFSFPDMFASIFGEGYAATFFGVILALIAAGIVAAFVAFLIGLPVLRLKSDYLAIATLGFGEIIRAIFQWNALGKVTNGANALKSFPTFSDFNITNADGEVILRLSTFFPFLIAGACIVVICMLINSSYGRAFKAIRENEIAAEAMGINLAHHKRLSFMISSFFAGVGGALFAMFATQAQAKTFTSSMTYEILLIMVIGGIGSISGSCIGTFLYVACSEWWLRFLDSQVVFTSVGAPSRVIFLAVFAIVVVGGAVLLIRHEMKTKKRKWAMALLAAVAAALMVWWVMFVATGNLILPLAKNGFRMVVFSVVIMIIVLFFRRGIMGDKELTDVAIALSRKMKAKKAAKTGEVAK
ncbi:MAG: branched-chain amino acid ABC transporter permease [Oscillospiraceae bacterium]|nr:branched-chain amino acid ABC transporter permease [Oscillospiraceae bacterium]